MNNEELVLKFWNSWQTPANWEEMRGYLSNDYTFDAGMFYANSPEESVTIAQAGNPWKDVELLDIVCNDNKAALIYQGTDYQTGIRYRVSEFLTIKYGKIHTGYGTIAILP